jgi:hypothetical protein
MQKTKRPIVYSLISGCVWAVIGFAIAWSVSPVRSTPAQVVRAVWGGLVAAPVIGVLVGLLSRNFSELGWSAKVTVALANLYLAVWLFIMAANVVKLLAGEGGWSQGFKALVSGPIIGAFLGLTYTGFVLFLWPLSYVNHTLIGRAWKRA